MIDVNLKLQEKAVLMGEVWWKIFCKNLKNFPFSLSTQKHHKSKNLTFDLLIKIIKIIILREPFCKKVYPFDGNPKAIGCPTKDANKIEM